MHISISTSSLLQPLPFPLQAPAAAPTPAGVPLAAAGRVPGVPASPAPAPVSDDLDLLGFSSPAPTPAASTAPLFDIFGGGAAPAPAKPAAGTLVCVLA